MPSTPSRPNTPTRAFKLPAQFALYALVYLVAGSLGAWWGYGFGMRMGGSWFALLAALNGAVFSSVLADAFTSRLLRLRSRNQKG
jgi:uncharacterized membrane protein